jgi:UDP-N-acetylglucosamine:LPS N-acetylglucosamine transferase
MPRFEPSHSILTECVLNSLAIARAGNSSKRGMENTLVPKHNIKLHSVSAVGLRGKNLLALIKAPFLLLVALLQTLKVFVNIKFQMTNNIVDRFRA